ncbi:four helix bundle protein [Pseudoalteromonas haloplanktis]|uniref:four helix bundle protein n=1 Tax=Pseudoalteromonas haloplanktis TaxID=228 RepID=UPI00030C82DD|nr:four helix bundle protein [Pseudoalteromonas haloplanktis]
MNFEKLEVWKRAARLSADVYKKTSYLKDFGFRDQLTRSSLSVPSNIAEGMTRESNKERLRFLDISRSSLAEARTQIYIGIDISYIDKNIGAQWINETIELSKMLTALKSKIKFVSRQPSAVSLRQIRLDT